MFVPERKGNVPGEISGGRTRCKDVAQSSPNSPIVVVWRQCDFEPMVASLETRKPIVMIEASDLDAFSIWEFCLDEEGVEGMDETWVRPLDASSIPRSTHALIVAALLTTANGLEFKGVVGVNTAGVFEISGFAVPFPRYCFVATAAPDSDKTAFARIVGAPPQFAFPVKYRLCATIEGETAPRAGEVA